MRAPDAYAVSLCARLRDDFSRSGRDDETVDGLQQMQAARCILPSLLRRRVQGPCRCGAAGVTRPPKGRAERRALDLELIPHFGEGSVACDTAEVSCQLPWRDQNLGTSPPDHRLPGRGSVSTRNQAQKGLLRLRLPSFLMVTRSGATSCRGDTRICQGFLVEYQGELLVAEREVGVR
jgi:hypothetical protein